MRELKISDMQKVSGGSEPGLNCSVPTTTNSTNGTTSTESTSQVCQTSSGLTIIKTTDVVNTTVNLDLSATLARFLTSGEVKFTDTTTSTSSSTTVCTPKGDCTTTTIKDGQVIKADSDQSVDQVASNESGEQVGPNGGSKTSFEEEEEEESEYA